MTITFENQQMIVDHDSGHRDIYAKSDVENVKGLFQGDVNNLTEEIATLDLYITEIENS